MSGQALAGHAAIQAAKLYESELGPGAVAGLGVCPAVSAPLTGLPRDEDNCFDALMPQGTGIYCVAAWGKPCLQCLA